MGEESGLVSRWQELRRHPAAQVAAVYVGASWALIQLADIFFPSLDIVRRLGIALTVGFPFVVGAAWWLATRQMAEPVAAETPDAAAAPARGVRRRRRRFAYTAAIGLLVVGGIFWWIRPNILGAVAPDAQVIAVLPFNTSGPGVELLGEGMVDLISPNLDAVGGIRTVDPRTVLHRWRQRSAEGGLDFAGSLAVGRDVDAGAVLLGSVVSAGPTVRLSGELYSVKGDELASARAEGPADSVLALVDSLGIKLLREIWLAREPLPNLRVSGITTGNVDAIRAYLRGQRHYRRSQWDSALVAFQEAVDADSAFALAHYRLGLTYGWSVEHGGFGSPDARRHASLALRYADRLPPRERMLVASHHLFEQGAVAAHDTMALYVNRYTSDPEGWYLLGDIRYHARPLLALDRDDLFEPFDRVLELDPSMAPALIHPLELSLAYDDSARYDRYLDHLRDLVEPAEIARFQLAQSFWERPDSLLAWFPQLMKVGGGLGGAALFATYESPNFSPNDLLVALGTDMQNLALNEQQKTQALRAGGLILASVGRLAEASTIFDTLWAIAPENQVAYFNLIPVVIGIADTTFARAALDRLRSPPPDRPGANRVMSYALMLYELSQGRAVEARRLANRVLASDTAYGEQVFEPLVRAGLGWADILDGDTVAGLAELQAGLEEAGYVRNDVQNLAQPLRAAWMTTLAERPETRDEGIRRLRNSYHGSEYYYLAVRYLQLGQALEAAGDRAGAAAAYSQFIRLWEQADPELQPRVETARRALERLTAEKVD